ncbi:unnamed protein product [Mortierella alpina]
MHLVPRNSHYDPLMQKTYYVESSTGKFQWEFPDVPALQAAGHLSLVSQPAHVWQATSPYSSVSHAFSNYQPHLAVPDPAPEVSYHYRHDHDFEYYDQEFKKSRRDQKDKHRKSHKEDKRRKDCKDGNGEKSEKQREKEEEEAILEELLCEIHF